MIQISPELLKPSKTSKKRSEKDKDNKEKTPKPIIPASQLKQRLLKRLKDVGITPKKQESEQEQEDDNEDTDEFKSAMHFLSDVRKKRASITTAPRIHNLTLKKQVTRQMQPQPTTTTTTPTTLTNTTLTNPMQQSIMVDLPPELMDVPIQSIIPKDDAPYGCLKGGKKRTYREWKRMESDVTSDVRPPTPPKRAKDEAVLPREEKLEQIRMKLKKMQELHAKENQEHQEQQEDIIYTYDDIGDILKVPVQAPQTTSSVQPSKRVIKKTIKRTYTLGKRPKHHKVSVLIKNKDTRKKIINAQQELRKTNIQDVRNYLKQHGLIKIGSTCPPDILRKTFEVSMLAGEVTNTNVETAMHNLMSDE